MADKTESETREEAIKAIADKYEAEDVAAAQAAGSGGAGGDVADIDDEPGGEPNGDDSGDEQGGASGADDEPAGGGEGEDDDPAGAEDDPDGADDQGGDEEDADKGFKAAADKHKIPLGLDDIPEEARPLVQKRLKEVERGFTRAMQEAREYRARERGFQTEEAYRKAHPVEFVAALLAEDPELEDKVAAELEKRRNPDLAEARKVVDQANRDKAAKAVRDADAAAEARAARGEEVETLAQKACARHKIPFNRGVEAAIANEILTSDDFDIPNERIDAIVKELAEEHNRSSRASKREERKRYVADKVGDGKSGPKIRPGTGGAPRPGGDKKPRSLEENMAATAERLFPGAP